MTDKKTDTTGIPGKTGIAGTTGTIVKSDPIVTADTEAAKKEQLKELKAEGQNHPDTSSQSHQVRGVNEGAKEEEKPHVVKGVIKGAEAQKIKEQEKIQFGKEQTGQPQSGQTSKLPKGNE